MSAKPYSVVLGAGLMGRLMAHQLSLAGHRVVVHEALGADAMGSAARVAAAMLAPLAESAITEPIVVRMGQYALNRWPHILSALSKPVFFQQNGTLIVWHRQDAGEAKRFEQLLINNQKQTPQLPELQKLGQKNWLCMNRVCRIDLCKHFICPKKANWIIDSCSMHCFRV